MFVCYRGCRCMESLKTTEVRIANSYALIVLNVYMFCDVDTHRFVVACPSYVVILCDSAYTRSFYVHGAFAASRFRWRTLFCFWCGSSVSLSLCLRYGVWEADSAFGLATWHQWSSRSAMERVSDIDIQSLRSLLSEVLLLSQSSEAEEDICL